MRRTAAPRRRSPCLRGRGGATRTRRWRGTCWPKTSSVRTATASSSRRTPRSQRLKSACSRNSSPSCLTPRSRSRRARQARPRAWPCGLTSPTRTWLDVISARPSLTRAPGRSPSIATRSSTWPCATASSTFFSAAKTPTPWYLCAACSSATRSSASVSAATASAWRTIVRPRSVMPWATSPRSPSASPAPS